MLATLLFALLLGCAFPAHAELPDAPETRHLTSRGRFMLTGNLGGFYSTDDSVGVGANWRWGIYASPGLSYFVRDRVGVGVFGGFAYREAEKLSDIDETEGSVGVRMMFDVPLARRVSLFVWPWFSYHWAVRDERPLYSDFGATGVRTAQTLRFAQLALFLPLLFHATESLGIGLGPIAYVDFAMRHTFDSEGYYYPVAQGARQQQARRFRELEPSPRFTTGLMSTIVGSF